MKLSTKIDRINLKFKILDALVPLTNQLNKPYDGEGIILAYNTFFKRLDEILNIKLEE